MSINDCRIVDIPTFTESSGKLSVFEENIISNFVIKRIYYLYELSLQMERGNHAYTDVNQIIVPIVGEFKIFIDDTTNSKIFHLTSANTGIYISKLIWRKLYEFTPGTIILVLADKAYKDSTCIKNYRKFNKIVSTLYESRT